MHIETISMKDFIAKPICQDVKSAAALYLRVNRRTINKLIDDTEMKHHHIIERDCQYHLFMRTGKNT